MDARADTDVARSRPEAAETAVRAERLAFRISIAVPLAALACSAALLVRHGIDLPHFDDWRTFLDGRAGSLALEDLFRPANDTIFAIGRLLDALAVRFLAYNGVAYQLLTHLACLGLLLYFQQRLLMRSLPRLAASTGVVACVFMMQPNTYWGLQNLAYHQALPLVALLASLTLTLTSRLPNAALLASVAGLGVLGGFAYISGAVVAATTALALFALSFRGDGEAGRRLRFGAAGFAIAAILTLPPQLWVILVVDGGKLHNPAVLSWTYPWTPEFWAFLVGMVGRAIGARSFPVAPNVALSLLLTAAFLAMALACLAMATRGRRRSLDQLRLPAVVLALFCGIGAYALMVAASRASAGASAGQPLSAWLILGGWRFHFFWVTLLLPWLAGLVFLGIRGIVPQRSGFVLWGGLSLLIVGYAAIAGAFNYSAFYRIGETYRRDAWNCIQEKLLAGVPAVCGSPTAFDVTRAIENARALDVSFTRGLLFRDELPEGSLAPVEMHDLGTPVLVSLVGGEGTYGPEGATITSNGIDPQVNFRFAGDAVRQLGDCRVLHVAGRVAAPKEDVLQLFVSTPEAPQYNEKNRVAAHYGGGGIEAFDLVIGSPSGFLPDVRIDPGTAAGEEYRLTDLAFSCR